MLCLLENVVEIPLFLLLTSAYGLVNANAKWQEHSDTPLRNLGLSQSRFVPILFFKFQNNQLKIVVVKIDGDVLITVEKHKANSFISSMKSQYKLGTIAFGPVSFLFNGLQIIQDTDFTIRIHVDSKLESLNCFPIDRRRKQVL